MNALPLLVGLLGALASQEPKAPPKQAPPPLRIEVAHQPVACPLIANNIVCTSPLHWSFRVGLTAPVGPDEVRGALRLQARPDPDPIGLGPKRVVTILTAAGAPTGLITELMVAVQESEPTCSLGFEVPKDPAAPPDPGPDGVLAKPYEDAPLDLTVGLRLNQGKLDFRVDQGAWLGTEQAWTEQVRSRKPTSQTRIRIDAGAEVPWAAVLRLKGRLERWGFAEFSYLTPRFSLDGPIDPAGISDEDAAALGAKVEQGFRDGNLTGYERAFCREEMLRRAAGSLVLSIPMRLLLQTMADQFAPSRTDIRKGRGEPPALKYLSVRTVDGSARPVFRQLLPDRLDYVEFQLGRDPAGTLRIVDLYSWAAGEFVSETLRSNYLSDNRSLDLLNHLLAPTLSDLGRAMPGGEMFGLVLDKKPQEALAFFEKNAATLGKSKPASRFRVNVAGSVSLEEFAKAVDDLERTLPGDSCLPLMRIQRHLAMRDREKGLKAIDEFETLVRGDAYLDVLRADFYFYAGDHAKARALAEQAAVKEPTLDRAWWTAITICLAQKDFAATAKALTATEKALGITLGDLSRIAAYAEFVKSAEYQEWMKARR